MAEKQLVLSFFADEAAADATATALKDSGITSGDSMGILVLDATGNLKVGRVGPRCWGTGPGIGACLAVLGAAEALHLTGLKLSDEDKARISADLGAGKAAVGVLARIEEAPAIEERLTALGGATSGHDVVDEAALQAAGGEQSA